MYSSIIRSTVRTPLSISSHPLSSSLIPSSLSTSLITSSTSFFSTASTTPVSPSPIDNTTATVSIPFNWQNDLTNYSRALVRGLAPNFASEALRQIKDPNPTTAIKIDQNTAELQHQQYITILKKCIKEVIIIPPVANGADSVFIEDTAVVVGNTALITRPGHPSRRIETEGTKNQFVQLGYNVQIMQSPAILDGGDVLFTGKEFFVGLSRRTNEFGIETLRNTFPGFRVTTIPLTTLLPTTKITKKSSKQKTSTKGNTNKSSSSTNTTVPVLHLKSICSMIGPDVIAITDNELGQAVAFYMQDYSSIPRSMREAGQRYRFLLVPDALASNNLFINGSIITPSSFLCPESNKIIMDYANDEGYTVHEVDNSELAKADGALTCCSILLK